MKRPRPRIGDDSAPAEWVEAATSHPGYEVIRERMEQMLAKYWVELEQPTDALRTAELRGAIAALRAVMALPAILQKELA